MNANGVRNTMEKVSFFHSRGGPLKANLVCNENQFV